MKVLEYFFHRILFDHFGYFLIIVTFYRRIHSSYKMFACRTPQVFCRKIGRKCVVVFHFDINFILHGQLCCCANCQPDGATN